MIRKIFQLTKNTFFATVYIVFMTLLLSFLIYGFGEQRNAYIANQPHHQVSAARYFIAQLLVEIIPVIIFFTAYSVMHLLRRWITLSKVSKEYNRKERKGEIGSALNFRATFKSLLQKTVQFCFCALMPLVFELIFEVTLHGPRWYVFRELPKQAAFLSQWTILFVVGAAICEELICRQMLFRYLLKKVPTPLAIVLSCFGFGLVHWIMVPGLYVPFVLSTNFLFCVIYLYIRNGIWCSSGAHFGMNLAGFIVWGSDLLLVPTSNFMLIFNSDMLNHEYYQYRSLVNALLAFTIYLFIVDDKNKNYSRAVLDALRKCALTTKTFISARVAST